MGSMQAGGSLTNEYSRRPTLCGKHDEKGSGGCTEEGSSAGSWVLVSRQGKAISAK